MMTTTNKTRAVTLKCRPDGVLTLAHPGATPGKIVLRPGTRRAHATIHYRITGVPAGVSDAQVMRAAERTALLKWLYHDESDPDSYIYEWADLGAGNIVKH